MQPRFTVGILVLKAEGVVSTVRYSGFLFQTAPTSVVAKPNQVAVFISHFARDAGLVAVEVVGLLAAFAFSIGVVADLRQRFVAGGAVGFTGLEDEGGLAVKEDVFGDGLSVAKVGEEWEGDGRDLRRSRRRRPTEIRLLKSMVRPSERFCIQDGGGAIAVEVF